MPALLPILAAACGERAAAPQAENQDAAERPLPQRAAERTDDGERYACGEGVALTIDKHARVAWITFGDGTKAELPRAESASKGGGDVFVGKSVSAMREGRQVKLYRDDGSAVDCAGP